MDNLFSIIFSKKFENGAYELWETLLSEKGITKEFITSKDLNKIIVSFDNVFKGSYLFNKTILDLSKGFSNYINTYVEEIIVNDILKKEYQYENEEENQLILKHFRDIRTDYDFSKQIYEHFQNQSILNVEGLIKFRAQNYIEHLRSSIEYALDEYALDKQYEEFISLLSYLVYIQEPKRDLVYVKHKSEYDFRILDENMKPIDLNEDKSVSELLGPDYQVEDMLISNLISISPQNIIVFTEDKEHITIKTLQKIFEDRVTISNRTLREKLAVETVPGISLIDLYNDNREE